MLYTLTLTRPLSVKHPSFQRDSFGGTSCTPQAHPHVDAAAEVAVLVHEVTMAVLLRGPFPRPPRPRGLHGGQGAVARSPGSNLNSDMAHNYWEARHRLPAAVQLNCCNMGAG